MKIAINVLMSTETLSHVMLIAHVSGMLQAGSCDKLLWCIYAPLLCP